MADLGTDIAQIVDGDVNDTVRIPVRKGAVAGWLYSTTAQLAAYVATKLFGDPTGQAGKAIIVNATEDGFEFGEASGGGGSTITAHDFGAAASTGAGAAYAGGVWFGNLVTIDADGEIESVVCELESAESGINFVPVIYANNAGAAGAVLAQGPQVNDGIDGENVLPLTAPLAVSVGDELWIGCYQANTGSIQATYTAGTVSSYFIDTPPANDPGGALTAWSARVRIFGRGVEITPMVLDDLGDVDTTTTPPTDGQALVWDDAGGLWVPGDVASGGGGGSTAVGAHRYWRMSDMHSQTYRSASLAFAGLEIRPSVGGSPYTISAMSASSSFSGQPASNLIDGNNATVWGNDADENRTWLIADLGSAKVVGEIALTARADAGFEDDIPKYFSFQYADSIDGPWTEVLYATLADVTAGSQVRTVPVPLNWPQAGGSGPGGASNVMAKGRIQWDSAGVATVVGGYNVASVTRDSAGHFTVAFTNPIPAGCVAKMSGRFGDTSSNDVMIVGVDRAAGQGVTTTELNFVSQVSDNSGAFDPYAAATANSWVYFEVIDPTAPMPGNAGSTHAVVATVTGTAYDLLADDNSKYIRFTNAAAKTVTVRPDATEALPANGEWHIRNVGAADLTIAEGSGVTVNEPAGGTLIIPQGGTATLKRVAVNEFDLMGVTT